MDATTDTNLLSPVRDGDLRALAELSEHPGHRVLGHCLRRTADHALAEDCLSMVFLEAWRHRRSVRLAGHSPAPLAAGRRQQRASQPAEIAAPSPSAPCARGCPGPGSGCASWRRARQPPLEVTTREWRLEEDLSRYLRCDG